MGTGAAFDVRATLLGKVIPGTLFILFALAGVSAASPDSALEWVRVAVNTAFVGLIGYLYFIRLPRVGERSTLWGAIVAIAGTLAPMSLTVAPLRDHELLLAAGSVVTVLGLAFSLIAVAALGRCFGIFPEARGLVTHGPYRWVRHPLYVGEFIAVAGIVISVISPVALVLYAALIALQWRRALNEEQALSAVFPDYAAYARQTARFIPFLTRVAPVLEQDELPAKVA